MTEVNEGFSMLLSTMAAEEKCEFKAAEEWEANLAGDSTALGNNLGNKPNATHESQLTKQNWPSQAHHLIPHIQLNEHAVAKWLKQGDTVYADTKYNVDHENNGKWMPYASSLPEWSGAGRKKKRDLMFKVMRLSGIQLHQGPHSRRNRYGIGVAPYKERVNDYLELIREDAVSHYVGPPECEDCKGKKQAKKYPPRNNTVTFVDAASFLIEADIDNGLIFVSRIAAEFAQVEGFDA